MNKDNLTGSVTPELVLQLARLKLRLAPFGYCGDEALEMAIYHGLKTVECVAISHEAGAARLLGERRERATVIAQSLEGRDFDLVTMPARVYDSEAPNVAG